jgi:UDP-2,3-diacylglucosamine pyrophosphatase LpxH
MPEEPKGAGPAQDLPEPLPELLPPADEGPAATREYFDPERWDGELTRGRPPDDQDPLTHEAGRALGRGRAALFVSDFHMGDGTTAGDDSLDAHLHFDERFDCYTGFFPPGGTKARLFAAVATFALRRLAEAAGPDAPLDVVLHGDLIDFLALKGRGGARVGAPHAPFFHVLKALRRRAEVYWLRGNHDYIVPSGPWGRGELYVNPGLKVLAEHGDFWDKENWPPGPTSKGARLVIEGGSAFEVHATVLDGEVYYLMAGLDNVRPWSNKALKAFLDRRARWSDVAWLGSLLARLKYLGAADDSAAYKGAMRRRRGEYRDWLMVQGHTHVPAAVPGAYYNTGTWITTLVTLDDEERTVDAFPFLLVYAGPDGRRVEEYYIAEEAPGRRPRVRLQGPESVNECRRAFGYDAIG